MRKIVKGNMVNENRKIRVFDYGADEVNEGKDNDKKNNTQTVGISQSEEVVAAKKIAEKTILCAEKKAQDIIDDATKKANEKANRIINDAQIKSDTMAKKVFDDEEKKGYENGFKQSRKELFDLRQYITNNIDEICDNQKRINDDINSRILDLSLAISLKIINKNIKEDETVLLEMLRKALNEVKNKSNINIIMSQKITENIDSIKEKLNKDDIFNRYIDFSVTDSDEDTILIDAGDTIIDMSVDTQLDNIKNLFTVGD